MNTHLPVRLARFESDDRDKLITLFARLSDDDRRSRFMGSTTVTSLSAYVAAIDFNRVVTIGAWNTDGTLVAVVEAFAFSVDRQYRLEAAFATDPAWRRLGLAKCLFLALVEEAAHSGVDRVVAQCEVRNKPMRALLRGTEAAIEVGPKEVCASWSIANALTRPHSTERAATPRRATAPEAASELFFA